ncbi:flagellar brake protein [Pseudoduganella namucuonensis]|uniref:Flagellar brake protein YcgR n=1 Tax=Pseudoduganella namucuonensis TaxID=1035707 RepID=A0A1I7L034_9BURK|nr:flagellar brake protein [Pseudoduganella namucuonensis]SFV02896.1 c-di-GMP-binding flagellar brake protein YcgR, contains PilZNR and PilZ domains [Pseudoduganella namucuonensis]
MQANQYNAELENWHDFEVESRKEIIGLLRSIGEKNQLIRMLVHGEADVCVTSILEVDADNNSVILDCSINPEQNQRVVGAKALSYETTLDKIRILFSSERVEKCTFEGAPAFKIPLPASLIRLQRREYYRMNTPVSNPVRAVIPLPAELGGGSSSFPLADISCGGIAILDNKLLLGDSIGKKYEDCRIDLPEVGTVVTSLQIRNMIDLTLLNNKSNRRLGCQFVDMPRGALNAVQRYITKLERERNARIAGLG